MERVDTAELTEAEQLVWKAFGRGAWVDFGAGGTPAVIRAEVIGALLLGAVGPEPGCAAGIRVRGATITGSLELSGGTAAWPMICEECRFDTDLGFVDSSVRTVAIVNSELPAFHGTRLRLDGLLDLTGSKIADAVRLGQARVTGQLRLREIQAGTDHAMEAVTAEGLSVDGDADCTGMEARGLVSFEGASVTGTLNLSRTRISRPGQRGLNLNYATIGGKLSCHELAVDGETRANNCRVTAQFTMASARLENPGGIAFFAGGLEVGGGAFFTPGFVARGEFRLIGARLAANLSVEDGIFENPGGVAVNLGHASISTLNADRVTCRGELDLEGASVSGDVRLAGAALETGDGPPALNAERAQIGGTLVLRHAKAAGEVNMRGVQVGERLMLTGAEFRNPFAVACRLTRAQVTADVVCDRMTAEGQLRLAGATVGNMAFLSRVTITDTADVAVDARGMRTRELVLHFAAVKGSVDLRQATVDVLRDDPEAWADQLYLTGLNYRALDPTLPAGQRLHWLERDPEGYQSQPYEQLAAYYQASGQPVQARRVQYARERLRRRGKGPAFRVLSLIQDIAVGYGYRPLRALTWLGLLLVAGSVVFSVAPPPPLQPGAAPHFNGIIYTLDLMLPVVNLGQKYSFNPRGAEQWLSYFLMAAGWTLATTVAAGAARVLRRE
jgi:hypothetical protein